jgi:hypothetical protein
MPAERRVTFGAYEDGRVHHEIVGIKAPDEPWQLVDIAMTPIERFAEGEHDDAVCAVALDYLRHRAA